MKKSKKLLLAGLGILVTVAVLCTSALAWFYFPTSKKLTIKTAPDLEVQTRLYHLEPDSTTGAMGFVPIAVDSESNSYKISKDIVYFQWGEEFLCESDPDDYYALEIVYDADTFKDGNFKSILNAALSCQSDVTYIDDNNTPKDETDDKEVKLRFGLVTLEYKYAVSAFTDLSDDTAVAEALGTYTNPTEYLEFALTGEDDQTQDTLELTGSNERIYMKQSESDPDIPASAYRYNYTDENNQTQYQIRLVVFLKVSADSENVGKKMPSDITVFGTETNVEMTNVLTIEAVLRSVPIKTE